MTRPYALYDVVVELLFGQRYSFQKSTAIAIAIANDLMVLLSSKNDVEVIVMKEPKFDVSVAAAGKKTKERIKLYTEIVNFRMKQIF